MKFMNKFKFVIFAIIAFAGVLFFKTNETAAFETIGDISSIHFETEDVYGNTFTFDGADGVPAILMYGGIPSCGNTTYTVNALNQVLGQLKGEKIKVYAFDIKDNSNEEIQKTADLYKNTENMVFSSVNSITDSKELYRFFYFKLTTSYLSMPMLVYKDANGIIYYLSQGAQSMESIGAIVDKSGLFTKKVVFTYDIEYEGKYLQEDARSMLSMINNFRTSAPWVWERDNTKTIVNRDAITYSYQLEKVAMKRAAEIALYYDHARPDNTPWYFAMDEEDTSYAYVSAAENIAWGYKTAEEVFEAWKEEDEDYWGQGHRRNMLSDSVTEVGIAHIVVNGNDFWVQTFGAPRTAYDNTATTIEKGTQSFKGSIAYSLVTGLTFEQTSYELTCKETIDLNKITVYLQTNSSAPALKYSCKFEAYASSFKVAKVEAGIVKFDSNEGTEKIYLSAGSLTGILSVKYSHNYKYKNLRDGEHTRVCKDCNYSYWADVFRCSGGKATYKSPAICEKCGKPYGKALERTKASTLKVSLSATTYTYNGKIKTPTVKVKTSTGTTVSSKYYTVSYSSGRKKVGTYTVKLTFKKAYVGVRTCSFRIIPPATTLTSLTTKKGQITAKWDIKNTKNTQVDGYEIRYSTDKKFSKSVGKLTINRNTCKTATMKKLNSKKTYYVRVRTYKKVKGKLYYSKWTAIKSKKVK